MAALLKSASTAAPMRTAVVFLWIAKTAPRQHRHRALRGELSRSLPAGAGS